MFHAHGGFVLGSETIGGVRDMVVRRNRFLGTDVGLRFKSVVGRGGKTERMYISDIMMTDIKDEAIGFQCDYVNRHAGDDGKDPVITDEMRRLAPQFQDIHITNVVCRGCNTGIKAKGIKGLNCISNINISNCQIVYTKTPKDMDTETTQISMEQVTLKKDKME